MDMVHLKSGNVDFVRRNILKSGIIHNVSSLTFHFFTPLIHCICHSCHACFSQWCTRFTLLNFGSLWISPSIEKGIMPATGTPEEQESNPSTWLSTNLGGAFTKQILEDRGLPCFDVKGEASIRWKRWKRAFNLYVASKGVTNAGQKVVLLLHSGGIELQEIYYTLASEDQDTSFNTTTLQSWITILLRKLMFHLSDMFSPNATDGEGNYRSICVPSVP